MQIEFILLLMTKEDKIRAIAKKVYNMDNPSLIERQQIERFYKFRDPEKGLARIKFQSDETYEFNDNSWKKQKERIEYHERKERINNAASYISTTNYREIYKQSFKQEDVKKRANEVRYIKDTFDLNFPELAEAINNVLGYRRFGTGDVAYIYKRSGRK